MSKKRGSINDHNRGGLSSDLEPLKSINDELTLRVSSLEARVAELEADLARSTEVNAKLSIKVSKLTELCKSKDENAARCGLDIEPNSSLYNNLVTFCTLSVVEMRENVRRMPHPGKEIELLHEYTNANWLQSIQTAKSKSFMAFIFDLFICILKTSVFHFRKDNIVGAIPDSFPLVKVAEQLCVSFFSCLLSASNAEFISPICFLLAMRIRSQKKLCNYLAHLVPGFPRGEGVHKRLVTFASEKEIDMKNFVVTWPNAMAWWDNCPLGAKYFGGSSRNSKKFALMKKLNSKSFTMNGALEYHSNGVLFDDIDYTNSYLCMPSNDIPLTEINFREALELNSEEARYFLLEQIRGIAVSMIVVVEYRSSDVATIPITTATDMLIDDYGIPTLAPVNACPSCQKDMKKSTICHVNLGGCGLSLKEYNTFVGGKQKQEQAITNQITMKPFDNKLYPQQIGSTPGGVVIKQASDDIARDNHKLKRSIVLPAFINSCDSHKNCEAMLYSELERFGVGRFAAKGTTPTRKFLFLVTDEGASVSYDFCEGLNCVRQLPAMIHAHMSIAGLFLKIFEFYDVETFLMPNGWDGWRSIQYLMSGGNFHYSQDMIIVGSQLFTTEAIEQFLDEHPEHDNLAKNAALNIGDSSNQFAKLVLGWYKSMAAGDVRNKLFFIFEFIPAYRLFVSSMREKPKGKTRADMKNSRNKYTAALKTLIGLLPALSHFNYAKVLLEDLIRWQHRVKCLRLREFHAAACWINDKGQGLEDFAEGKVRFAKPELMSRSLMAIKIAWTLSDLKSCIEATFRKEVGLTPERPSAQRPNTNVSDELKEMRGLIRKYKCLEPRHNDNVVKTMTNKIVAVPMKFWWDIAQLGKDTLIAYGRSGYKCKMTSSVKLKVKDNKKGGLVVDKPAGPTTATTAAGGGGGGGGTMEFSPVAEEEEDEDTLNIEYAAARQRALDDAGNDDSDGSDDDLNP